MARPAVSGFSTTTGTLGAGGTMTWAHTAEAGKGILVCLQTIANLTNIPPFLETVTFGGVPLTGRVRWIAADSNNTGQLVFTLPADDVVAGTDDLVFTCVTASDYGAIACNVSDWTEDADVILAGGYFQDSGFGPVSLTRSAYGWGVNGLQVGVLWGYFGSSGALTLSGTAGGTGDGIILNTQNADDDFVSWDFGRSSGASVSMLSFLIPSGEHARTDGAYQPWFTGNTAMGTLTASDSVLLALPYAGEGVSAGGSLFNSGTGRSIIPYAGTLRSWAVRLSAAPGGDRTITGEIWRGGIAAATSGIGTMCPLPTGVTITLGVADTIASIDLQTLGWSKYERLFIRYTMAGTGALAAGTTITSTLLVESGETQVQAYGGGGTMDFLGLALDTPYYRSPLHPRSSTSWQGTSDNDKGLVGVDMVVEELLIDYQISTAIALDHQYYLDLNGTLQDGGGGSVDTVATLPADTLGPAIARSKFSLDLVPGDLLAEVGYIRDGGSDFSRQSGTIRARAVTNGQFMLSGHVSLVTNPSNVLPTSAISDAAATADQLSVASVVPPMTVVTDDAVLHVLGLRNWIEPTGPGVGETLTEQLQRDNALTTMPDLVLTGSAGAPLGGVVGGDVEYIGEQTLGTLWTASMSATLDRQFFTIPGYVLPQALASITVVKDAGGDVTTSFDFTATNMTPTSFSLVGGASTVFSGLAPGSGYGVAEIAQSGWQLDSVVVSNADPADNITLGVGEAVTVTFTNSQLPVPVSVTYPIRRLRRAPHLSTEQLNQFFSKLQIDMQTGVGTGTGQASDPVVMVRWSNDGGFTWSHEHWLSAGKVGEYSKRAILRRLGRGRDRIFEVVITDPVFVALLDVYLNASKGSS